MDRLSDVRYIEPSRLQPASRCVDNVYSYSEWEEKGRPGTQYPAHALDVAPRQDQASFSHVEPIIPFAEYSPCRKKNERLFLRENDAQERLDLRETAHSRSWRCDQGDSPAQADRYEQHSDYRSRLTDANATSYDTPVHRCEISSRQKTCLIPLSRDDGCDNGLYRIDAQDCGVERKLKMLARGKPKGHPAEQHPLRLSRSMTYRSPSPTLVRDFNEVPPSGCFERRSSLRRDLDRDFDTYNIEGESSVLRPMDRDHRRQEMHIQPSDSPAYNFLPEIQDSRISRSRPVGRAFTQTVSAMAHGSSFPSRGPNKEKLSESGPSLQRYHIPQVRHLQPLD